MKKLEKVKIQVRLGQMVGEDDMVGLFSEWGSAKWKATIWSSHFAYHRKIGRGLRIIGLGKIPAAIVISHIVSWWRNGYSRIIPQ